MKMAGTVAHIDPEKNSVTVRERFVSGLAVGDFLFAAEPGEHIAYRRVPTGGWHFLWWQIVVLAGALVGLGVAIGAVVYG